MRILIVYHSYERERYAVELIKQKIQYRIPDANIVCMEFYEAMYNMDKYPSDILVSTILPRDDYSSCALTVYKKMYMPKIYAFPAEGFMQTDEETMKILIGLWNYPKNLVDHYFFWGKFLAQNAGKILLQEERIDSINQIHVIGNPLYEEEVLEIFLNNNQNSSMLSEWKQKSANYDGQFLFLTGFLLADCSIDEIILEGVIRNEDDIEEYNNRIEADKYFRDKYIDLICAVAHKFDNKLVTVKMHPIELQYMKDKKIDVYNKLRTEKNICVIDEAMPIGILIKEADCMIHYCSTAEMEAYMRRVPTICCRNDYSKESLENKDYKLTHPTHMINVSEKEKLLELLKHGVTYTRNPDSDNSLDGFMNYRFEEEYTPSKNFAEYIYKNIKAKSAKISRFDIRMWKSIYNKHNRIILRQRIEGPLSGVYQGIKNRNMKSAIRESKNLIKVITKVLI